MRIYGFEKGENESNENMFVISATHSNNNETACGVL